MNLVELMKVAEKGERVRCTTPNDETYMFHVAYDDDCVGLELQTEDLDDLVKDEFALNYLVRCEFEIVTPKYYIKHRWIKSELDDDLYLLVNDEMFSDDFRKSVLRSDIKREYTRYEIKDIKQMCNTDLRDFEIVEVEE